MHKVSQIFKSSFATSFGILCSRVLGFIRDIIFANTLGISYISDIIFIIIRIPNFFRTIFAEGAFSHAFIPLFSRVMTENQRTNALSFAREIFCLLFVILLIFTFILQSNTTLLINMFALKYSSDPQTVSLLVKNLQIALPYLILISIFSFIASILNALGYFFIPSFLSIFFNIGIIASLTILSKYYTNIVSSVSWGLIISGFLQMICIYFYALKKKVFLYPKPLSSKSKIYLMDLKGRFFYSLLGNSVTQINSMIDLSFSSAILAGTSYIYYSERLINLPLALIGTAISISLLPSFSKSYLKKDYKNLALIQQNTLDYILLLLIPTIIGMTYLINPIINTIFVNRNLSDADGIIIIKSIYLFTIGLLPMTILKANLSMLIAIQRNRQVLIISITSLLINIIFNFILIKHLQHFGIILSTVIANWVSLVLTYVFLYQAKTLFLKIKKTLFTISISILSSLIMLSFLIISKTQFFDVYAHNKLQEFFILTCIILISIIIYFALIYTIHIKKNLLNKNLPITKN